MNRSIVSFIASAAIFAGCALTPATASIEAAACDDVKSIPVVGMVAAIVCAVEEPFAKDALAADVAAHPPASTLPVPAQVASTVVRKRVTRRVGSKRVHVGYFPPERAERCQAWIDAHATDVPRPQVSMWSIDGGITPSVESLAAEVQRLGVIVEGEHGASAMRDGGKDGAP